MASLDFILKRRGKDIGAWIKAKGLRTVKELIDACKMLGADPLSQELAESILRDAGIAEKTNDEEKTVKRSLGRNRKNDAPAGRSSPLDGNVRRVLAQDIAQDDRDSPEPSSQEPSIDPDPV